MDTSWRPADCPPLAWPALADDNARLHWYRQVCSAYAALLGEDDAPQPGTGALAVQACEARLGYALPPLFARYHCAMQDAYPSLDEIDASAAEHALATDLLVFGNYLGNGNLWCFHRVTGAVYYFDHDDGAMLTRMFDSVAAYLDALMLLCLGEVYDDDDSAEALLKARFGAAAIRKWRY